MKWSQVIYLLVVALLAGCATDSDAEVTSAAVSDGMAAATNTVPAATETPRVLPTPTPTRLPLPSPTALPTIVRSLVSGPTPTAFPLPTRVLNRPEVVVATPDTDTPPEAFQSPLDLVDSTAPEGETEHFTFYVVQGSAAPPMEELGPKAEEIYDYVSERLGANDEGKMTVLFRRPPTGPCPARGIARPALPEEEAGPFVTVFAGEESSHDYVYGVLAHEVAHILHAFSDWNSPAGGLTEGFAHWLAEAYVNEWYSSSSYEELVRGYIAEGTYRPLHRQYELTGQIYPGSGNVDCVQLRDLLYTEWGSFIGFLVERYGKDDLKSLMESGRVVERGDESVMVPADFLGVYGLGLNQLEAQWLRGVLGG